MTRPPASVPVSSPRWKRALATLGLEFGYFSGLAGLLGRKTGGLGVIIRFERVRPRRPGKFQPLLSREISPEFLDRVLRALRRWRFDIIPIGDVAERLRTPAASRRRFVCLTFDGGYRDFFEHAYPVLARHGVPCAVYVPASFPDGLGELWWLALEEVIASHPRLGLVIDGHEQRLACTTVAEKNDAYRVLYDWLRSLPLAERSAAIRDLCGRYRVDLKALSEQAVMSWPQLMQLAADPLVTIGSATLNYTVLARSLNDAAEREMKMGRAVLESATGRAAPHFAYPFGDSRSFGRRHLLIASQLGFATAATSEAGVITADSRVDPMALPRIAWDGRRRSLRALRVILSGVTVMRRRQMRMEA